MLGAGAAKIGEAHSIAINVRQNAKPFCTLTIPPPSTAALLRAGAPATGALGEGEMTLLDLDALEGIVQQAVELAELARVIQLRQRRGQMHGVRGQKLRATAAPMR